MEIHMDVTSISRCQGISSPFHIHTGTGWYYFRNGKK